MTIHAVELSHLFRNLKVHSRTVLYEEDQRSVKPITRTGDNVMYTEKQLEIIETNARFWGQEHSENRLMEEMAELQIAIFHHRRGKCSKQAVLSELGDTITCLHILAQALGDTEYTSVKEGIASKIRLVPKAKAAEHEG